MMRKRRRCLLLAAVLLLSFIIYFPILLSIRPEEMEVWNATRSMATFVRPENNTALISGDQICKRRGSMMPVDHHGDGSTGPQKPEDGVFLLVVVCSSVSNFKHRQVIRETWASPAGLRGRPWRSMGSRTTLSRRSANKTSSAADAAANSVLYGVHDDRVNLTVKVLFLLGRTENATMEQLVQEESDRFRDLVQEDFRDTYNNLTLKTAMMLKWVNGSCPSARYIMKTDDDSFVNVPRLVAHLQKYGRPNLLLGCLICYALPVRNKQSKWYTPRFLFNERFYPSYLSGAGYVMSGDLVPRLFEASLATPFFHLEDIYLTGLCARRLKIKPVDHEGFTYQKRALNPCLFHLIFTSHQMSPSELRTIWKKMWAKDLKCDMARMKLRNFRTPKC